MEYAKGFKFRIYPNAEQQEVINQTLGCARFVYNHFVHSAAPSMTGIQTPLGIF